MTRSSRTVWNRNLKKKAKTLPCASRPLPPGSVTCNGTRLISEQGARFTLPIPTIFRADHNVVVHVFDACLLVANPPVVPFHGAINFTGTRFGLQTSSANTDFRCCDGDISGLQPRLFAAHCPLVVVADTIDKTYFLFLRRADGTPVQMTKWAILGGCCQVTRCANDNGTCVCA